MLHTRGRGADCIENAVLLLLPCVYSVVMCLTVSYLATLWPSTLQYVIYMCLYLGCIQIFLNYVYIFMYVCSLCIN
jgi:hypothetical protein